MSNMGYCINVKFANSLTKINKHKMDEERQEYMDNAERMQMAAAVPEAMATEYSQYYFGKKVAASRMLTYINPIKGYFDLTHIATPLLMVFGGASVITFFDAVWKDAPRVRAGPRSTGIILGSSAYLGVYAAINTVVDGYDEGYKAWKDVAGNYSSYPGAVKKNGQHFWETSRKYPVPDYIRDAACTKWCPECKDVHYGKCSGVKS